MGAKAMAVSAVWQPIGAALWARIKRLLEFTQQHRTAITQPRAASPPVQSARPVKKMPAPNEVFTPTRPRAGRRALVGRHAELAMALQALNDEAAHVVLYSERGRGKTSLANLVVEKLRRTGVIVGRHACDAASDFDQIIQGLLRDLPQSLLLLDHSEPAPPAGDREGCVGIVPSGKLLPADVAAIPARLACDKLVFVVDEFDRVNDDATRLRLADTIKLLSDRGSRLLFVIVGVSTTLEHILGQHPSIERNITSLHLPLLTDDEIGEMLTRGGNAVGIRFTDAACDSVAGVARGMPYMAQLMGLRITQNALLRNAGETAPADVAAAIDRLLADVSMESTGKYALLASGENGVAAADALLSIARAGQDKWGRMTLPPRVAAVPGLVESFLAHNVLLPVAGVPGLFQFGDRKLMYYVLLLAARAASQAAAAQPTPTPASPALRSVSGAAH